MRILFGFLILIVLFPNMVLGQKVFMNVGISELYGEGDFDDDYNYGYTTNLGVEFSLSRKAKIQFLGQFTSFSYAHSTLQRHEVISYNPFESELVTYQVDGGNFSIIAIKSDLKIIPFPSWEIKPYFRIGLGLAQNLYHHRTTNPSGSVFERKESKDVALLGVIGVGTTIPLISQTNLSIEGSLKSSAEIFGSRNFYNFGLGLEYEF